MLEDAPAGFAAAQPDNLAILDGRPVWSSGLQIFGAGSDNKVCPILTLESPVTALAARPSGLMAVATEAHGLVIAGGGEREIFWRDGKAISGVTAMTFADDRTLLFCVGSTDNAIGAWQRDLLDQRRSGSLWRVDVESGELTSIATKLAFPNGILALADGSHVVSEAWNLRLIRIDAGGRIAGHLIEDLPGYPRGSLPRDAAATASASSPRAAR